MKIKTYIVSTLFIIMSFTISNAELPYESDHEHSFVVTGGKQWYNSTTSMSSNKFTLNYNHENKFSFGLSHRRIGNRQAITIQSYGNIGWKQPNSQNPIGTDQTYNYTILYAQINPFNLNKIKFPLSFSVMVGYQSAYLEKTIVASASIYNKYSISNYNTIQPVITIGYRDIAYHRDISESSLGLSLIFSQKISDKFDFLIIPQTNDLTNSESYLIQFGISHGVNK